MRIKLLILFGMVFLHILDDFVLQQAWLANGKQKSWWNNNTPSDEIPKIYKNDYKMALFIHSLSWTISIMILPLLYFPIERDSALSLFMICFFLNMGIHYMVDDLKANKKYINLVFDQCIHLFQVFTAWVIFCFVW